MNLEHYLRNIPDFPKPGIQFKDISPLLAAPKAFNHCIEQLAELADAHPHDAIAVLGARGFIFGSALALLRQTPLVLVRKAGKLPGEVHTQEYALEYGSATMEMHIDAIQTGDRVIIVDDLIATGGTMKAACELVETANGQVAACLSVLELAALNGREILEPYPTRALLSI